MPYYTPETYRKFRSANSKAAALQRREAIALKAEETDIDRGLLLRAGEDNAARVKILLARGADPCKEVSLMRTGKNIVTTAFHEACEKGSTSVVRLFIAAGANRNVRDSFNMRPQDVIANESHDKKQHKEILDLFMQADVAQEKDRRIAEEARRNLEEALDKPRTGKNLRVVKPIRFTK